MRALFFVGSILLGITSCTCANAADVLIIICNVKWTPPCRNFPVSTLIPPKATADMESYSLTLNDLSEDQILKVISSLGIDASKINLKGN